MSLPPLPTDWEPTRVALHNFAQAITALPRAGVEPDPRWAHVALRPVPSSGAVEAFSTVPVRLEDGSELASTLDVLADSIVVAAGDDRLTFALSEGVSPHTIGSAIAETARSHGSIFDVETERYADDAPPTFDEAHAIAWFTNTAWVTSVLRTLNEGLAGELSGPHIWSHGFDLATEWYSQKVVNNPDGSTANAEIVVGFYPAGEPYFYVTPWPFDSKWTEVALPHDAVWNTEGWYGVKLDASTLNGDNDEQAILDVARFVHDLAGPELK